MDEKVTLKIRRATLDDVKKITEIANSVKINYDNPQENGFLVYFCDEEGYRKRIGKTPYFYVAERNNEVVAFLLCFDNKTVEEMAAFGDMAGEDKTFDFIFSQKKPFILADQLAVLYEYSYQGIGKALFDKFFEDLLETGTTDIYGELLHKPARNNASINFCKSLGFEEINEITNNDDHTWGIYKVGKAE